MEDGKDCTMVIFNMRIPRWKLKRAREIAKAECRSAASLVNKLIQDEINRKETR